MLFDVDGVTYDTETLTTEEFLELCKDHNLSHYVFEYDEFTKFIPWETEPPIKEQNNTVSNTVNTTTKESDSSTSVILNTPTNKNEDTRFEQPNQFVLKLVGGGHTAQANFFIEQGFEQATPNEFYRELFPQGELITAEEDADRQNMNEWKYNGIILHKTNEVKYTKKKCYFGDGVKFLEFEKPVFKKHVVYDDLTEIDRAIEEANSKGEQIYMAPISYLGHNRSQKAERFLYAVCLEIDGLITEKVPGKRALRQKGLISITTLWNNNTRVLPPTAVVCSGTGIHCYYFLKEPYPLFGGKTIEGYPTKNYRHKQWKWFRDSYIKYIWNEAVSSWAIQYEGVGQPFRVVGSLTKTKDKVAEAFWVSKKRYSMEDLLGLKIAPTIPLYKVNSAGIKPYPPELWDTTTKSQMDLSKPKERPLSDKQEAAKEAYPNWYNERIIQKKPKRKHAWSIKRDLYDWYRGKIRENPHLGCRYFRIYTLAQYASKCGISFEEFEGDAKEAAAYLNLHTSDAPPLEDKEVNKAMMAYFNPNANESTIDFVNAKAHLDIVRSKRNYQTQHDHLQADVLKDKKTGKRYINTCKQNRILRYEDAVEDGRVGRPKGSGGKQSTVREWRAANPAGKKAACIRETGLDKKTVYKWWDIAV